MSNEKGKFFLLIIFCLLSIRISLEIDPVDQAPGYKTFFMLNSLEH